MRLVLLYRPQSEHARQVEAYAADFERFHPGEKVEQVHIDSIEGSELARLYGVMDHPAVVALKDDGQLQQMWVGVDKLPLMNDLAYYAQQ